MKTKIILFAMIVLLGIGLMTQPVNAHGSDDEQVTTMPGMPGMPSYGHMPGHMMGQDAIWLTTDVLTVMAVEDMPVFHYWYTGDNNGSLAKFMAAYSVIAEFEDLNGDSAFQSNETLFFAPLSSYEWTIQTGSVEDENGVTTEIWLKYTKGGIHGDDEHNHMMPGVPGMMDDVHMYEEGADIERFEDTTVQIWARLYMNDYEGHIEDSYGTHANYTVMGGSELKIDLEIGNFPFSSNTSQVAIQTVLNENMGMNSLDHASHMFQTHEHNHNVVGTSMMNWTGVYGNESMFEGIWGSHMQQVDFIDMATNESQGFYRWLDQAIITWPGGESEAVNVTTSYAPTGMGLGMYFAYPNFSNGTLIHDPSIGLFEEARPLGLFSLDSFFAVGIVGIIILVAVFVVFVARRR
ncbi:MAG: hypothetical protein ACW98Y_01040 [Candidatus Thorarchaeota archaeon]